MMHAIRPTALAPRQTPRARQAVRVRPAAILVLLAVACAEPEKQAASGSGADIYARTCAGCHEAGGANRAPSRNALAEFSPDAINLALKSGAMRFQGVLLTRGERHIVAEYLSGRPMTNPATLVPTEASRCVEGATPGGELLRGPQWVGWGVDLLNSRFQPDSMARLKPGDLPRMAVKWAFGFPAAVMARSQPTITGGRAFFGSHAGIVYSVDAATGCTHWTYQAAAAVRTSVSIARVPGSEPARYLALFGDERGAVYAVDAMSGVRVWRTQVDSMEYAKITATPTLHDGRLYVSMSSEEELASQNPSYTCCKFRGSVSAIDAWTGKVLWRTFTAADTARPTGRWPNRLKQWGPSGAPVWTPPTVDTLRRAVYVTTGNSYTNPVLPLSDAVVAFDMDSGRILWSRQLLAGDTWNFSCVSAARTACPISPGPDFDFGAPPMLRTLPGGGRLLIAGQKSGVLHAIDPDRNGAIVWQAQLGKGGNQGSIMWGPAADTAIVYVALSVVDTIPARFGGGLYALRIRDGSRVWYTPSPRATCTSRPDCSGAQTAPLTLISGVVFSGSRDGHLRGYSTADGAIIWDFDTLKEFATVNGAKARGGSLNATSPVVVNGKLYVLSGYGFGGMPGNILLALEPGAK